jgi:hypothetical protein
VREIDDGGTKAGGDSLQTVEQKCHERIGGQEKGCTPIKGQP